MRHFINVVEQFDNDDDESFAEAVRSALEARRVFDDEIDDMIGEAQSYLGEMTASLARADGVIYRLMRLTPSALRGIKPGDSLGKHWTLEHGRIYSGNINDRGSGDLYWFIARVSPENVDWADTVASALMFSNSEAEINPFGNIVLLGIRHETPDGPVVRPDLNGKTFGTGQ